MGEIGENDFNVWKAKAISRGKLLDRFRDRLQEIVDHAENESDRVYFGSTNHLDDLKGIADEMDMWKWDRIVRERPEPDPYAECRELRAALASHASALAERDAEIPSLREVLSDCQKTLAMMIDPGTIADTSVVHAFAAATAAEARARAALAGGSDG